MKTKILFIAFFSLIILTGTCFNVHSQNSGFNKKNNTTKNLSDNYLSYGSPSVNIQNNARFICTDAIISTPQNKLYFCYGGNCDPFIKLHFEITSSHSAAATNDSTIVWLMTDDKDGSGPLSSFPDSMLPGYNIKNSTNRAKWLGGIIPFYVVNNPVNWISPFSFQYILPPFWADSGRAICFTPIAFDSTAGGQLFEKDSCFGIGQPIQKVIIKSIFTEHYFSCDSGINYLHLITKGGLPQYNHLNGYTDVSIYSVQVNTMNFSSHYGDTLHIAANDVNYINISDSLGNNSAADGCVIYFDTLRLFSNLGFNNLSVNTFDNAPNDTFSISPVPSGAMQIDFLCSDPVSNGIYLLNANDDTVYSKYPLGLSIGPGNIADVPTSLFVYNIPIAGGPYRIVATNDFGSGWQDLTCNGLTYDGFLKIYDLATGDSLSGNLYPIGDNQCGGSGFYVVDTFGVYSVVQYNKTLISSNALPSSLSGIDSSGNVIFSPATAGVGTYAITFTYNDNKSNLCDKDTMIVVVVNTSVGIAITSKSLDILINNPVHDRLKINSGEIKIGHVEIFDASGKFILTTELNKAEGIDFSGVSAGIYFIKIFDFNNSLYVTKKFVKE